MWVPLHQHSQYSILDATACVEMIAKKACEYGMPAVALTDHGNLFGAVEFYKACTKCNVKPIIGCELYIATQSRHGRGKEHSTSFHLTMLAADNKGYHNLCRLTSLGYLEGFYYKPRVDEELLERYNEGLICLSGCMNSPLSRALLAGDQERALQLVAFYKRIYPGRFYIELQRHPMTQQQLEEDGVTKESWLYQRYADYIQSQQRLNDALLKTAADHSLPIVATNDGHYIGRHEWRAHEVMLNIQSGETCFIVDKESLGQIRQRQPNPKRRTYPSHEFYFKSPEEMAHLFKDLPEAISNTLQVADSCNVELDFKSKHYPVYKPPSLEQKTFTHEEQQQAVEEYLRKLCQEGIAARYTEERLAVLRTVYPGKDPLQLVHDRLEYEMSVIAPKGMCDYLLIVWDFINWAKSHGIPVGPGRGSGAGSIILYLIGVTDIEPLRFKLFFERFINPERISYPDIDVDICMEKRGEVIRYTLEKYGKESLAQIVTFGSMKAKMSVKDVGRAYGVPLSHVNAIAKLIPDDLNITLKTALEKDLDLQNLYYSDEQTRELIDVAMLLEGSIRSTGIHAAGVIISGEPLIDLIPLFISKEDDEMPVTQYSMKPVELVGMLKIDFLGLKTLTAIQYCVNAIEASTAKKLDWVNLPLDDRPTFDLLNQGHTQGVFQLESAGMQELARHLHLDCFEEIIAVGALYRPGPMDMIPSFINRKHGREPIEYDHPWLEEILSETYGIMVYQEQVMAIAQRMANYSLGEGDVLRRAMGKKDSEQMAKEREKFRQGAISNGISEELSMRIFDQMEKFASYGFNKSHAAAYGYLSYVTAYLKANHPKEWMAALMTCDLHDTTKLSKFIRESQSMGIEILPPDVNEASDLFVATSEGIRYAMSGIKGVGRGVVEHILSERRHKGRYASLYDFCRRIDGSKVGKKIIECLVEAGCFDFTGWSRDALKVSVVPMFEASTTEQKEKAKGFMNFFDLIGNEQKSRFDEPPKVDQPSTKLQLLLKEKELLGLFLTGHPMEQFKPLLQRLSCVPLSDVESLAEGSIFRSVFLVEEVQVRISAKNQRKFAILRISDDAASHELPIWPELFTEKQPLISENQLLYAVLQIEKREGEEVKLGCRWLAALTSADDTMIEECDRAFDKAKQQQQRRSFAGQSKGDGGKGWGGGGLSAGKPSAKESNNKEANQMKESKSQPEQVFKGPIQIAVDANAMRHSDVLKLKELFERHAGQLAVEIHYRVVDDLLACLHIDERWGVSLVEELIEALKKLPFVVEVKPLTGR